VHPPRFGNAHKQKIFALTNRTPATGTLRYSRWRAMPLPETLPSRQPTVDARVDVFDYAGEHPGVWHVNFADPHLFVAYGSALLAQDELQAVEHPALGAIREALLAEGLVAATEERDRPTPVLITEVERRCILDTEPDIDRPLGLYGNRFVDASFETVQSALTILEPPTHTNLIAMAAPVGHGIYSLAELTRIVEIAYTGFVAAVRESSTLWPSAPVEVRTGFWGCGVFGGNRTLMLMLQLLAARLAGVDRIMFYTVRPSGLSDYESALSVYREVTLGATELSTVLERACARKFAWGEGDGN
jgi:hypothetical protein